MSIPEKTATRKCVKVKIRADALVPRQAAKLGEEGM
jgi:hypothetical protein